MKGTGGDFLNATYSYILGDRLYRLVDEYRKKYNLTFKAVIVMAVKEFLEREFEKEV